MKNIAGAILIVGLAAVSVYAYIKSGAKIGAGWGFLAGLTLFMWSWESKD